MKKIVAVTFLALITRIGFADEWVSPIDVKYKNKNEKLFSEYSAARDELDQWRGQREYLAEAGKVLTKIIQEDAAFAPAHRELGRLYIMAGYINGDNYEKGSLSPAEKEILKSIEIEPDYADSYVLLGHLYTNLKNYSKAMESLKKADEIGTKIPWLDLNYADLYIDIGADDLAEKKYLNVVESNTNNKKAYGTALQGLAKLYTRKGDFKKADEWYEKTTQYEPESAWNWGNYANFLLYRMNDADRAIKNGEQALKIMDYGMGRFTLACALFAKWAQGIESGNDPVQAQKLFDRAYALYPNIGEVVATMRRNKNTAHASDLIEKHSQELNVNKQS